VGLLRRLPRARARARARPGKVALPRRLPRARARARARPGKVASPRRLPRARARARARPGKVALPRRLQPPMPRDFHNLYAHGLIRAAVCVPFVRVADPAYNGERTIQLARRASDLRSAVALFPE